MSAGEVAMSTQTVTGDCYQCPHCGAWVWYGQTHMCWPKWEPPAWPPEVWKDLIPKKTPEEVRREVEKLLAPDKQDLILEELRAIRKLLEGRPVGGGPP